MRQRVVQALLMLLMVACGSPPIADTPPTDSANATIAQPTAALATAEPDLTTACI